MVRGVSARASVREAGRIQHNDDALGAAMICERRQSRTLSLVEGFRPGEGFTQKIPLPLKIGRSVANVGKTDSAP